MTGALGRGLGSLIPNASAQRLQPAVEKPGVLEVPIHKIVTNPRQPRKSQDHAALEDLINSIREHGIVQPLVMVKAGSGYQLIAGERRLKAAQMLGLPTVPAIVRDATTQQQLELAIVENVQRKDLNPMERAHAYRKLIDEFSLTQEHVAKRVGKSRVTVTNTLRLLDLPADIQQAIIDERITEGHAKVIASAPTPKEQLRLFAAILKDSLSVRSGEQLARRTVSHRQVKRPANPTFVAAEDDLRERFATRVRIDKGGKVGTITIEFYSDEEFAAILKRLRQS